MKFYPVFLSSPLHLYLVFCRNIYLEFTCECGMRIPEPYELDLLLHQETPECGFNFRSRVTAPVDVAAYSGSGEEVHIIGSSQKADIINLRNSRREKLEGTGN